METRSQIEDRTALCHDAWRFHVLADSIDASYAASAGEVTSSSEWFEKMLADDASSLVDRLCAYEAELDARDSLCKQEIERLRGVMEITASRRAWGRKRLGEILDRLSVRKIETPTRMVLRTNGSKRAEPDNVLPAIDFADPRFVREVPAKLEWNRVEIKSALVDGEVVPGWHLALGEKGVQIR
jgi:hypothetical protein